MSHRNAAAVAALALLCAATQAADCDGLARKRFGHSVVTHAESLAAGSPIASVDGKQIGITRVPYCRIHAESRPTPDSAIRFELWVPSGVAWNGKFEQVGNGGFAGVIPYEAMAAVLSSGYAVAGTDDGHQSTHGTDLSWAPHHPDKVTDFGWRAIDETATASKTILRVLESKEPERSYFVGCSDGGREALMMAQRFPTYFDGIIAGAPASAMTRLFTAGALLHAGMSAAGGRLAAPQLQLLQRQALRDCGGGASYLEDPRSCHVNLDALKCTSGGSEACLSEGQLATARAIYVERKDPAGKDKLYAPMPGAEGIEGSWDVWITGRDDGAPAAGAAFTWNYLAYLVMHDPKFDWAKVRDDDLVRGERNIGAIIDSDSPDLMRFKAHGGKLIQYHGWNDPAIAPGYSLEYRKRLIATTQGVRDFYRLYMVPGMLHCGGGDAPTNVNWQAALENWVERDIAPEELVAGDAHGANQVLRPIP